MPLHEVPEILHPAVRIYDREQDLGLNLPPAGYDDNAVWLAFGLCKPYRITSNRVDYGEFETLNEALDFKRLLLRGNPDLHGLAVPEPA